MTEAKFISLIGQDYDSPFYKPANNEQLAKWLNTVEFNWYFDDPIRNWLDQPAKKEEWGRFWPW